MTRQREIEAQLMVIATLHAKHYRIKMLSPRYSVEQIYASLMCHRLEKREVRLLKELGIEVPEVDGYITDKA